MMMITMMMMMITMMTMMMMMMATMNQGGVKEWVWALRVQNPRAQRAKERALGVQNPKVKGKA
jgi:ATP-dependent Zn protease